MSSLRKEYNLIKERRLRSIELLVKEAIINVIAEQNIDLSSGGQQQAPGGAGTAPEPEPPAVVTPDQGTVPQQYTVDDMIQELNAIRSGRSFTDPEIYGHLVTFFQGLEEEQRSHLDNLLKQIAELVTGVDAPNDQEQQQAGQNAQGQPPPPQGAPQQSAPMPGAQTGAGAAGVGQI